MDPVTHGLLGAAIGRTCFYGQLGSRAAVIGAVVAMSPDLDIIYGAIEGPFGRLVSHRGVTHSLFFGPLVGTILGWIFWRRAAIRPDETGRPRAGPWVWIGLCSLALLSHTLLDLFTSFGTQLLAPLTRERFALHAIAIVDPAFTLILVAGLAAGALLGKRLDSRWITAVALSLSTVYLFVGLRLNGLAEIEAGRQLAAEGIENAEVHAFPTMLQLPHRRLVGLTPSEVRVGFISMWRPCTVEWGTARRVTNRYTDMLLSSDEGKIYRWFSGNLLAARFLNVDQQLLVDLVDLRYGFEPNPLAPMWGIRGFFGADGRFSKPPERIIDRPEVTFDANRRLMSDAFPAAC
jgi:inner membrane protein